MVRTNVTIKEMSIVKMQIPIKSVSPLIVNKFSEKAKRQIQDKKEGKAKNKKYDISVPKDDFEAAKHISPLGWDGFPAAGFKAAMVRAAKIVGMVMKDTQTAFFIDADCSETQYIRINGESRMREDYVRVRMGGADVRYRPEYVNWTATLSVTYNSGVLSKDQIYQLIETAGYFCGIGEMRPEKTKFNYGRWTLA